MSKLRFILVIFMVSTVLTFFGLPVMVSAKPAPTPLTPQPAGETGLMAAYVAQAGEHISGMTISPDTVNGSYDIGIYIAEDDVTVTGTTVTGANNEGILVQGASNVVIKGCEITGNATDQGDYDGGVEPPLLSEDKGIVLAGTTGCIVQGNLVENNGHGGIAVLDDGSNHPFAPGPADAAGPVASNGNIVKANTVQDNPGDCAIVVAAKNPGGGVYDNVVSNNKLIGGIGGIIVAGGAFGPVDVMDTVVRNNEITGGFIPGISIHAFGPGVITDTIVAGNSLSDNGTGELSGDTTGIEIFAVPGVGVVTGTQVVSDTVSNDVYGVWHAGDTGTNIANLQTYNVTTPVFP